MAPSNHPLEIAEIIGSVFVHLESSTLFKCALVNRMWAAEAIPLIWRLGHRWGLSIESLGKMPKYRHQHYANYIHEISDTWLNGRTYYYSVVLFSLEFPQLQSASFSIPFNSDEKFRLQYLVPSLRKLELYEHSREHDWHMGHEYADFDYVSDDFLLQIQVGHLIHESYNQHYEFSSSLYLRNAVRTWKNSRLKGHRTKLKQNRCSD